MTLTSANEAALEFGEIHPFFAGLLVELPKVAAAHDRAQSRLYPAPVAAGEEELCADWSEVVQPGLQHLFAANREIVTRDIASWESSGLGENLLVPRQHLDAWLNTLNQARLIVVEANQFTEADLDVSAPPDLSSRRGLALLKLHFYAHVQEMMLETLR